MDRALMRNTAKCDDQNARSCNEPMPAPKSSRNSQLANAKEGNIVTETRKVLLRDIAEYRSRIEFYKSLHLFEAAGFAKKLADNIELALTTMPDDNDPPIA